MNPTTADYAQLRRLMVDRQLLGRGISDGRVHEAMSRVPREEFVPPELRDEAYGDWPLPIGCSQTISQPYTVAFMAQELLLKGSERVLEIGTGSGYAAAVLSLLAAEGQTIERIAELGVQARQRLAKLGYDNVGVHIGDGTEGLPEMAPFDAIMVTASAPSVTPPYRQQLAEGGRLVMPIGGPMDQAMHRFTKRGKQLQREHLGAFAFVPLIGRHGWHN